MSADFCIEGECCTSKTCDELGAACGAPTDGCGGMLLCGECASSATCNEETWKCECSFVECQGACCEAGEACVDGNCCTPSCDGKQCGDDDGCGGKCDGPCLGAFQACTDGECACTYVVCNGECCPPGEACQGGACVPCTSQ